MRILTAQHVPGARLQTGASVKIQNPFRVAFVATLGVGLGLLFITSLATLSTILLYVGSPQSKESEDRTEEMLKEILRQVDPDGAEKKLAELDQKYPTQ